MKKLYYESPTVEVVDVRVEGGFAYSTQQVSYDPQPQGDAEESDNWF